MIDGMFIDSMICDLWFVVDEGDLEWGIEFIIGVRIIIKCLLFGLLVVFVEFWIFGDGFVDMEEFCWIVSEVKFMFREELGIWDVVDFWGIDGF